MNKRFTLYSIILILMVGYIIFVPVGSVHAETGKWQEGARLSAVIKQVVTALTNALDAKKIAMKAQESAQGAQKSAEDANVKAVDALDGVTGAVASIDQFTKDVAEAKKIADNALEKTSKADARIDEALKAATQAATVAVRSLELTSDTKPVAINAVSYALKTPLISNSAEIANN